MDVDRFLAHHHVTENPFGAEEARHDPVYERLVGQTNRTHPDFSKILGSIERPSTAVVFGEKGSGKTAIRLLIGRRVAQHNRENPDRRTLLVPYDDLNPFLDQIARSHRRSSDDADKVLQHVRLEDHQDAILSVAVTKFVDALIGGGGGSEPVLLPERLSERIRQLPRSVRVDIAVLAAIYDQPRTGALRERWRNLRRTLRLGWRAPFSGWKAAAILLTALAVGLLAAPTVAGWFLEEGRSLQDWVRPAGYVATGAALLVWGIWLWRRLSLWRLCRRIARETPAVDRSGDALGQVLSDLKSRDRAGQPWPIRGGDDTNNRYELTRKLMRCLEAFGYTGIIVLVDRVDEPTMVAGRPERMRKLVWPMFDSKFLQQERVGIKLLLPLELRYLVHRESSEFFQEARLDKQHLVDRLSWTGATLYDLCTNRLRACQEGGEEPVSLTDLFEQDVTREVLVEALSQMHQPRDAFKFLYSVIQEHCRMVPEEEARYQIPRLTLESVRREQSQRVQELYRGLSPA